MLGHDCACGACEPGSLTCPALEAADDATPCGDPDCLGWTVDAFTGAVCACKCGRLLDDRAAAVAIGALIRSRPVESFEGRCHVACNGWNVFYADGRGVHEIERCDDCARFSCDDDAIDHAIEWLKAARAA